MGTYKTGWLRLPSDPNDFKERFAWSHVKSIFYDKAKNILLKKKLDDMDGLIADHADAIANKLMTNDAFNTAIADYVTKAMMSSTQVNDANHVPTSSLAYAMQQAITANANAITRLNSELSWKSFANGVSSVDISSLSWKAIHVFIIVNSNNHVTFSIPLVYPLVRASGNEFRFYNFGMYFNSGTYVGGRIGVSIQRIYIDSVLLNGQEVKESSHMWVSYR